MVVTPFSWLGSGFLPSSIAFLSSTSSIHFHCFHSFPLPPFYSSSTASILHTSGGCCVVKEWEGGRWKNGASMEGWRDVEGVEGWGMEDLGADKVCLEIVIRIAPPAMANAAALQAFL